MRYTYSFPGFLITKQTLQYTSLDDTAPPQEPEQLAFNPHEDLGIAPSALDDIPRYLFRVVSPCSDGQTDSAWVRFEAACRNTESSRQEIFQNLESQKKEVVAHTLNKHLRWWPKDDVEDNFVSWASSLLFALMYIYYRHQSSRDGSSLEEIKLYVIDTVLFPRGTFDFYGEIEHIDLSSFPVAAPESMPELTRTKQLVHETYADFLVTRAADFVAEAQLLVRHLHPRHVSALEDAFPVAGPPQNMHTQLLRTLTARFGDLRAACKRVVDAYSFDDTALWQLDERIPELEFIVADKHIDKTAEVLSAVLPRCTYPDCIELHGNRIKIIDRVHTTTASPPKLFHSVGKVHFHTSPDDPHIMLSTDPAFPKRVEYCGPSGPWTSLEPVRILKPNSFTESLIWLYCRDIDRSDLQNRWRKMIKSSLNSPKREVQKCLSKVFQPAWECINGCQSRWSEMLILREKLIKDDLFPAGLRLPEIDPSD
ncbi:hypothetical protein BDW62DRAFT_199754 [Aspergillus aurantiobrunneus]